MFVMRFLLNAVHVLPAILYAKVVNDQVKLDGSGVMFPQPLGEFVLHVAMFGKALFKQLLC